MTINKYNGIFSVDGAKRKFYDEKTHTQTIVENAEKHEYDLNNENIYNPDGTLAKEAEPWQYEKAFRDFFIDSNLLKLESFLIWHYKKSESPHSFFIYVQARIDNNSTISDGLKVVIGYWLTKNDKTKKVVENNAKAPKSFNDIFKDDNWDKYISPLRKVKPMLINDQNEFVGRPHGHKGVICNWFFDLQAKSIVKKTISRQKLALVLNREFKNLYLNSDGKSFENDSKIYVNIFKDELLRLSGLDNSLP